MQSKTPLLMVTALVCGLGAAFGTWKLVTGAQSAPQDEVKVKVLVPVAEIAPYHLFQESQRFTEMEWPKSKLREDISETVTAFDQIKGKTSRHYKLRPNEPMYKNDICESLESDVSERLRNGEVAHAVQVTAERAAGGFVKVGDRIDISATTQPNSSENSIKTQYFLEDIEVLAVDNTSQKEANQMATPPTRFLLRLTRPQALVCKFYQDTAKLDFDKRKHGDPTRVGESFYFTSGKKSSGVPGYQDEPDATVQVAVNIEEKKLPEPAEDKPATTTAKKDEPQKQPEDADLLVERNKNMKHIANINVDGTNRKVETKATYNEKELVKMKSSEVKKDEGKKEEKKEESNNNPGQ